MKKPVHPSEPGKRIARAGDALVSNRLLSLASLLRRSANLLYRKELDLSEVEWRILAIVGDARRSHSPPWSRSSGSTRASSAAALRPWRSGASSGAPPTRRPAARCASLSRRTGRGRSRRSSLWRWSATGELVARLSEAEVAALLAALDQLLATAKIMLAQSQAQVQRLS